MAEGFLGNLIVKIGVDAKELNQGLKTAEKTASSFATNFAGALKGAGIVAAVASIGALANKVIDYGDKLNEAAERTGMTAAEIGKLKFIAEQSETSLEALTKSFRFLSVSMSNAASGNKEAVDTFKKFGVEFRNSDGTLRNYKDVLLEISDRIKNTKNETVILAEGSKLFGRGVQEIHPLLRGGSEEIKKLGDEYDKISPSDETMNRFAKKADRIKDYFKEIQTAAMNMGVAILDALLPLTDKQYAEEAASNLEKLRNSADVRKLLARSGEAPNSSRDNFMMSLGLGKGGVVGSTLSSPAAQGIKSGFKYWHGYQPLIDRS